MLRILFSLRRGDRVQRVLREINPARVQESVPQIRAQRPRDMVYHRF